MCAWCRYTRGRFESTHGGQGSSSVLLTKICPRRVTTCPRGSPKKPLNLTRFQFENRSRTTRARFLQSFALPDEAVQFQQSGGKQTAGLFDSFIAPFSRHNERSERQYRRELPPAFAFSNLVHHLSSPYSNHVQDHGTQTYTWTYT